MAIVSCTTPSSNTSGNIASPTQNTTAGANVSPSQNVTKSGTTVELAAKNNTFDKTTITVNAGEKVTIKFDNQDNVAHNFAVYNDSNATAPAIFQGEIVTGSNKTTYTFMAPAVKGTYFFRCDTHPETMTGTFTVK